MENLSVSGNIIKEVSEKVPSTTFAIMELIKNSYEAESNKIDINIYDERIDIIDDGEGMSLKDIRNLLIVSHSTKEYGIQKNGRYVSGEKGLGFFSIFKFGKRVDVVTKKNGKTFKFSLDMNIIENTYDIRDYNVDIDEKLSTDKNSTGTTITISDLYPSMQNIFKKVVNNPSRLQKLEKAILDENFKITISGFFEDFKKIEYSNSYKKELSSKEIANVKFTKQMYNHEMNQYYFQIDMKNKYDVEIDQAFNALLDNDYFDIKIDLDVYKLVKNDIKKFPDYYKDEKLRMIQPQIYFNNSYFDDFGLYNVEVNSSEKSDKIFRQQIGLIKIYLKKKDIIGFNADRTKLIESPNQQLLKELLDYISSQLAFKIREILNLEKSKEPKLYKVTIIKGEKLKDYKVPEDGIKEILLENIKQNAFDSNRIGYWELFYSTGDKAEINVQDFPGPQMIFLERKLYTHTAYKYTDIFEFIDYERGSSVEPLEAKVFPEKKCHLNKKKNPYTITATEEGYLIFKTEIRDKKTDKIQSFEHKIFFKHPSDPSKTTIKQPFIHPLSNHLSNVVINDDLDRFINLINEISEMKKFDPIFSASARSVLEVICVDIMDKLKLPKNIELSSNIKAIIKSDSFVKDFLECAGDSKERLFLKQIFKENKPKFDDGTYTNKFNFSTHGIERLITASILREEKTTVCLFYTFLLYISQTQKNDLCSSKLK